MIVLDVPAAGMSLSIDVQLYRYNAIVMVRTHLGLRTEPTAILPFVSSDWIYFVLVWMLCVLATRLRFTQACIDRSACIHSRYGEFKSIFPIRHTRSTCIGITENTPWASPNPKADPTHPPAPPAFPGHSARPRPPTSPGAPYQSPPT